jgi:hypothetical protein
MAATGDHLGATLFIRPPLTARRYVFWPASTPNLAGYNVIADETAKYLAKLLRDKRVK